VKILILTTTFPKDKEDYGTPRFVYDIAKNIADRNIKTIVLTPDRPNSKNKIEKYADKFYAIRYRYFIKNKQYLTSGEGIIPNIRKNKENLILLPYSIISIISLPIFLFEILENFNIYLSKKIDIKINKTVLYYLIFVFISLKYLLRIIEDVWF